MINRLAIYNDDLEIFSMKLVRFGDVGHERPGIVDVNGDLRDLSGYVSDISSETLELEVLSQISALSTNSLPRVSGNPRLGSPLRVTGKFIAVGLNYRDHAEEAGMPIPKEPIIFMKANSCVVGPNDDLIIPRGSMKTDWEVELGIVIGSRASYVTKDEALSRVAGYVVVNDVSERQYQIERGGTWDKGKSCDTFGPIGPWIVTPDEIDDVQNLDLWLDVNGVRRQTGNTATMIFGVAELVSYVSNFMTLYPGDVITTGTPPGVGMGIKPDPIYLVPGDEISLGIDRLGSQRQRCVAWSATVATSN